MLTLTTSLERREYVNIKNTTTLIILIMQSLNFTITLLLFRRIIIKILCRIIAHISGAHVRFICWEMYEEKRNTCTYKVTIIARKKIASFTHGKSN